MGERFVVHHLVTGPITRRGQGEGAGVTALSVVEASEFSRFLAHGHRTACHHRGGPQMLRGYHLTVRWPADIYREAGERRLWAEAMVWVDDTPERIEARADERGGYSRTHQLLWPQQGPRRPAPPQGAARRPRDARPAASLSAAGDPPCGRPLRAVLRHRRSR